MKITHKQLCKLINEIGEVPSRSRAEALEDLASLHQMVYGTPFDPDDYADKSLERIEGEIEFLWDLERDYRDREETAMYSRPHEINPYSDDEMYPEPVRDVDSEYMPNRLTTSGGYSYDPEWGMSARSQRGFSIPPVEKIGTGEKYEKYPKTEPMRPRDIKQLESVRTIIRNELSKLNERKG